MSGPASTDDCELVLLAFERFNSRDVEGLLQLTDPGGEFRPFAIEGRRPTGYRGHDGLRQYIADVDSLFETFVVDVISVRDLGDGVVLSDGHIRGVTRDGERVDMAASWLWKCRAGKLVHMQAHPREHAED
jgi:ketosteroid isomerase-like protein